MPGIEIDAVTKEFPGGVRALDELDLSIGDGEFFALLGPSGCGKTTLLRTIAGLEAATSGTIHIGDRDVTKLEPGDRNVAMVFQDYALYPHMTVRDNIAYPLRVKRVAKGERTVEAEGAAHNLSLGEFLERRPGQLSGGQQQRVALARAIATRPDCFLFDEPLSNLDARLRLEARTFLKQLQRELATTAVFVTHDQAEALALADRMAVMELGVIRQVGTPAELFHRPVNTFVAGFIGSTPMNLVAGTVVAGDGVGANGAAAGVLVDGGQPGVDVLPLADAAAAPEPGRKVFYGARPEYLSVTPGAVGAVGADGVSGEVAITENLGTDFLVTVDVGGVQIRATIEEGSEPAPGELVTLTPAQHRVLLYDEESGELIS